MNPKPAPRAAPSGGGSAARAIAAFFLFCFSFFISRADTTPQLSAEVADEFDTLRALVAKKEYPALLALVEKLLPKTGPESYDRALLSQIQAQVLLAFKPPRYADAIPPLETALLLGDSHKYFDTNAMLDSLRTLSELYYAVSVETRDDAARRERQRLAYERVLSWIVRVGDPFSPSVQAADAGSFLPPSPAAAPAPAPSTNAPAPAADVANAPVAPAADAGAPTPTATTPAPPAPTGAPTRSQIAAAQLYAATLLYSEATLDPSKPDLKQLRRALAHVSQSAILRPHADTPTLILRLAIEQNLGDNAAAAETLEFLAASTPANAVYFQQLASIYTNLAIASETQKHPPSMLRRWRIRALLAFDRAIAAGHRLSEQELNNRIALLVALEQHKTASALLARALADAALPPTRGNWELLASILRHQGDSSGAINTLLAGLRTHPADAELRHTLARFYYSEGRGAEAYPHLKKAVLGKIEKPAEAWFLLAYLAYELGEFDDALRFTETALSQPGANRAELLRLKDAVLNSVKNLAKPASR